MDIEYEEFKKRLYELIDNWQNKVSDMRPLVLLDTHDLMSLSEYLAKQLAQDTIEYRPHPRLRARN